jgi:hypothetical protein
MERIRNIARAALNVYDEVWVAVGEGFSEAVPRPPASCSSGAVQVLPPFCVSSHSL